MELENTVEITEVEFTGEDKKVAIKAFSRCHIATFAYVLIGIALIYIAQFVTMAIVGYDGLITLSENPYYIWGLQVAALYVIAFPLFWLMIRKLPSAKRERSKMDIKEFGIIFLISQAVTLLGSILSSWITSIVEIFLGHEIPDTTSELISQTPIWLIILVVVIIGPIVEEMIFRKALIDKLSIYGDRLAILVSAIGFGLFHGNLYQLFYATALGLILGYMYTKTRNSLYNCLMHMAINFMGTIPAVLIQPALDRLNALDPEALIDGSTITDYMMIMGVSSLQYLLAIAGIVMAILAFRNKSWLIPDRCDINIPKKDRPRVIVFNLGTVLFLLFCLAECVMSLFPA
ncbi:MAG: CPBP family intramembrane metalloprotease [Clostridia bacterium]|nr:CPBP family intramembrane metalloprotease [Clostridia bacterium]